MPSVRKDSQVARVATAGALVAIGYYLGARVGFALTLPPDAVSTLWPPNAIVLSALVLAPPRHWWALLLAALPAHLAVQVHAGVPVPMMLSWFLSNSSEALIGAGGVRLLLGGPLRLDSFRQVAVFLLCPALLGPFLSSFLDAGLVTLNRFGPSGYWQVWHMRFASNVVASLTLVPVIVTMADEGTALFSRLSARLLEVTVLSLALVLVCVAVFAWRPAGPHTEPALLYAPLPLLLWAAVRFGPAGASAGLLVFAVIAIGGATRGLGPFVSSSPRENALSVQQFLIISAVPLLVLAAVMKERERAQHAVDERLRFEQLVSELLKPFATMEMAQAEQQVPWWLERLGGMLGADRISVLVFSPQDGTLRMAHAWAGPGAEPLPVRFEAQEFQSLQARQDGEVLAIPLVAGGRLLGTMLVAQPATRRWAADVVTRLHWIGEVFGNLLARKAVEEEVRKAESLTAAVIASLPGTIAILDESGTVLRVGGRPKRGAPEDPAPFQRLAPGADYLERCRELCERGDTTAAELYRSVTSVLAGERPSVTALYAGHGAEGDPHWHEVWVERLARPEGGVIVTAFDVTSRKRAELAAARHRDDLAHMARVATMGELAASLTHELRQPLTAILSNAQAGNRLLAGESPDLLELREILADIGDNDRIAGDALRRMRTLLRKGELELLPVDLNVLVRDVVRLVHSDLLLRHANAVLDLDANLPSVPCDRIQLQQVVLNLVLNALEAMEETARPERRLTIRTSAADGAGVQVSVSDDGPGIQSDELEHIFDAFYTTKADGLGMGLSISRTILEAHGGRLWAANGPEGGATVGFTLPFERGD